MSNVMTIYHNNETKFGPYGKSFTVVADLSPMKDLLGVADLLLDTEEAGVHIDIGIAKLNPKDKAYVKKEGIRQATANTVKSKLFVVGKMHIFKSLIMYEISDKDMVINISISRKKKQIRITGVRMKSREEA